MKQLMVKHLLSSQNIYSIAFETALRLYKLAKSFPYGDSTLLRSRIMQSSGAVCSFLREAWHNRSCEELFANNLNDAAIEASEIIDLVQSALTCGYLELEIGEEIMMTYTFLIEESANMIKNTIQWSPPNTNDAI